MSDKLLDIANDMLMFVAAFRERLQDQSLPRLAELQHKAQTVVTAMDRRAETDAKVNARYQKVRFGLIALLDEVVYTSDWEDALDWELMERNLYGSDVAGNEVYDLIAELGDADEDLAEVWFYVLALGFRGKLARNPAKWDETLVSLYRRLPDRDNNTDPRFCPEAYHALNREGQRLDPLFNLWRSVLIFCGVIILLIVMYKSVWWSMEREARQVSREVITDIRDDHLRDAFTNGLNGED